jgi:hypothetical protein
MQRSMRTRARSMLKSMLRSILKKHQQAKPTKVQMLLKTSPSLKLFKPIPLPRIPLYSMSLLMFKSILLPKLTPQPTILKMSLYQLSSTPRNPLRNIQITPKRLNTNPQKRPTTPRKIPPRLKRKMSPRSMLSALPF